MNHSKMENKTLAQLLEQKTLAEILEEADQELQEKEHEFEMRVQEIVINALANLPKIQGEKGNKGDSVKGDKPIIGVDYKIPTAEEIAKKVKVPKPKDGKTPLKGVDYFDGKDAPKIEEILNKVTERLPELIKANTPASSYSLIARKSNAHFKIVDIVGIKDGSNRRFHLSEAPLYGSQLFLFLNGQYLHLGTHYSVSGVALTYKDSVPAPKSSWNHYVQIFKP